MRKNQRKKKLLLKKQHPSSIKAQEKTNKNTNKTTNQQLGIPPSDVIIMKTWLRVSELLTDKAQSRSYVSIKLSTEL